MLSTAILRTQSDRRLVALAQAGHEVAFTTIVERYRAQLRRHCLRILPEGRVDDALQQAFLLAWRALQDGRAVRELRPWLYTIVHNAAISQLRSGVFDYVELLDTLEGADGAEADFERRSVVRQTLATVAALPDRQRAALLAVALDGRLRSEVALEMGLTDNGLRQLIFRARSSVRAALTAITPIPLLAWGVRAAGAGAVAGGASALPTGTALVVAGTLAVGGAVGLPTPAPTERAPSSPVVAVTPTAEPNAAKAAPALLRRTGLPLRSVRAAGVARRSRPATRAHVVVALRGSRGLRVTLHRTPAAALRPAAGAPQFTAAPAPASAPPPAAIAAEAPAPAAQQPAPAEPAATVTPAAEAPAAPRAQPEEDDNDHGGDDADREDVRPPDVDDEDD